MRSRSRLAALAPVVWLALAGVSPVLSQDEQLACRGEPATLAGTGDPDEWLSGTPARDVIVSNGAARVLALDGDDLICVTDGPFESTPDIVVLDGEGEDATYVESTAVGDNLSVDVFLQGAGTDIFRGGPSGELVSSSSGADDVETGGGDDTVFVSDTARPDELFAGQVRLGADGGSIRFRRPGTTPEAVLDGGVDGGYLWLETTTPGHWVADGALGTATLDGVPQLSWTRIPSLHWGENRVTFHGGPADESLFAPNLVSADMGAGDDRVGVYVGSSSARGPRHVDGGPGRDTFTASDRATHDEDSDTTIDVPRGLATYAAAGLVVTFESFEDFSVVGVDATLLGGPQGEVLTSFACRSTVLGGGGADRIVNEAEAEYNCGPSTRATLVGGDGDDVLLGGRSTTDTLRGGPGADVLRLRFGRPGTVYGGAGDDRVFGGPAADLLAGQDGDDVIRGRTGADVLRGGRGRDTADGGAGNDRCVAERRTSCEA